MESLRDSGSYIPELALAGEENNRPIAHIMLIMLTVPNRGEKCPALLLAPVSVALEDRNKGIGTRLIKEGIKRAKNMGFTAVFLVGNPDYYKRCGFRRTSDFGVRYLGDIPEKYVMALELIPKGLKGFSGIVKLS